ncbi:uncharacterized protein LOC143023666 [Oratosquilla oratoria]|uniref:uncharacterized protein LOC143023666 n=1 Tax=Oratosquilla oratoria TaxID=337810 RepID=UPI003F75BE39
MDKEDYENKSTTLLHDRNTLGPPYNLALMMVVVNLLQILKNSSEFLEEIRGISVKEDEVMVSYDVQRLYDQRVGTPMISSVSVILAEITRQCFEEEVLVAVRTSLKLWARYVDNVFAVLKEGDVDSLLLHLSSKNETIQFGMEEEVEGKLLFLYVLVTHKRNSSISVYRKSTHTNHLLGYKNNHAACHKRNVVKTLWSRAERVCSMAHSIKEERNKLRNVFMATDYPNKVVKRWMAQQIESDRSATPQTTRVMIPYVEGFSEIMARLLWRCGVNVAHKPSNTLHIALMMVKDGECNEGQAGAVYEVKCKDCNMHYIGETGKKHTAEQ